MTEPVKHIVSIELVAEDVRQPERYRWRYDVTCSCREAPLAREVSEEVALRTRERHDRNAARRHR